MEAFFPIRNFLNFIKEQIRFPLNVLRPFQNFVVEGFSEKMSLMSTFLDQYNSAHF